MNIKTRLKNIIDKLILTNEDRCEFVSLITDSRNSGIKKTNTITIATTVRNIPISYNALFDIDVTNADKINVNSIIFFNKLKVEGHSLIGMVEAINGNILSISPLNVSSKVVSTEVGTITKGDTFTFIN